MTEASNRIVVKSQAGRAGRGVYDRIPRLEQKVGCGDLAEDKGRCEKGFHRMYHGLSSMAVDSVPRTTGLSLVPGGRRETLMPAADSSSIL